MSECMHKLMGEPGCQGGSGRLCLSRAQAKSLLPAHPSPTAQSCPSPTPSPTPSLPPQPPHIERGHWEEGKQAGKWEGRGGAGSDRGALAVRAPPSRPSGPRCNEAALSVRRHLLCGRPGEGPGAEGLGS